MLNSVKKKFIKGNIEVETSIHKWENYFKIYDYFEKFRGQSLKF